MTKHSSQYMVIALSYLAAVAALFVPWTLHAQVAESIWSGSYTEAQAERGAEDYRVSCAGCHGANLRGDSHAAGLVGMGFMFLWEGKSLGELYSKIRNDMPLDQPRSLTKGSYEDILAFILKSNEFPAGDAELESDEKALDKLMITAKPVS
jgi:mono/diheme cytochrome c family protein